MPPLICIPTTSGTGSEGGKSAVITYNSHKRVIGHQSLLPKYVALEPTLTVSMPPKLTFATGVDALFHCAEAYFVLSSVAESQGMSKELIEYCDQYALSGIGMILKNLPRVLDHPDDLSARLNMQIAAFYGAKAFRKGDLGGIHAAAHSLGSKYHLHHGESIGRMSVPVIMYNQKHGTNETLQKFDEINHIFKENGVDSASLAESVLKFVKHGGIEYGLKGLDVKKSDIPKLAMAASVDPCGTNPVPMTQSSYVEVFEMAQSEPLF